MNPVSLQRVVVRLLYDPAFAEHLLRGGDVPELDEAGRRMLLAVNPSAWRTDPYRRSRALTALLEEYPASAALVGVARLDAFFSSAGFHRAIQARLSLAVAFGGWIEEHAGPVARLERGVALARRQVPHRPGPTARLATAPGFHPLDLPQGALETWQILRARLGANPVEQLARKAPSLEGLPRLSGVEHLLIERGADGQISVGACDEALAGLLRFGLAPRAHPTFVAEAIRLGADPDEAPSILHGLIEDGLLVVVPAAS